MVLEFSSVQCVCDNVSWVYSDVVRMSCHIPGSMCVGVTVWFGWGGVVSLWWLKHYWSVHVGCGGWGLMAVWNSGFVSPGLCSEPHGNTNTHRTRYVITYTHDIRIYSGNFIKNTLHTRELKNHRKPQQPIFTETRLLKQPHTSRLTTRH